jgi:hypothetical protein
MKKIALSKVKPNPENPRVITEEKFGELKQSLIDAPWMIELRPLTVDEDFMLLGGNMRLRALTEIGYKEVPVQVAKGLTDEQKKEFIIKDNISSGSWDWDMLGNTWDAVQLREWGLHVWTPEVDVDYSILDTEEFSGLDERVDEIVDATTKAIQINFLLADFDEAYNLIKVAKEEGFDVATAVLELLRNAVGESAQ